MSMSRRVLTFLSASLILTLSAIAYAQEPKAPDMFKDVDTSHWAYPAVESLRSKNVLVGYPDGYFRGKRTLTRYEFAVALDRALKQIPIQGNAGAPGPPGSNGLPGPKGEIGDQPPPAPSGLSPQDIALMRRLTQEFREELSRVGSSLAA